MRFPEDTVCVRDWVIVRVLVLSPFGVYGETGLL